MQKQYSTTFREFITRDDNGRYHVRLGPQVFSTDYQFNDVRIEGENGGTPVSPELLQAKPWIMRNLRHEVGFQHKKAVAIMFGDPCFRRERYSANQRIAYKNALSNGR